MVCRNCASPRHTNCSEKTFYARASDLSVVTQSVKDGKLFSVIPTAIANTAVIRVHPTEASRFEIQPGPKELQLISQHLEDTLRVLNAGKVANDQPKPLGTADKMAQSIKGLL